MGKLENYLHKWFYYTIKYSYQVKCKNFGKEAFPSKRLQSFLFFENSYALKKANKN